MEVLVEDGYTIESTHQAKNSENARDRMSYEQFWRWFSSQSNALVREPNPEIIVDTVVERLSEFCPGVSIEVAASMDIPRELVFTAGGYDYLFPRVRELVDSAPDHSDWVFVALKPPRGFEFTIDSSEGRLQPSTWEFIPLESSELQTELGLSVVIPDGRRLPHVDLIKVALQTGIGEEAFSYIRHVEARQTVDPGTKVLNVTRLQEYIRWHRARYRDI